MDIGHRDSIYNEAQTNRYVLRLRPGHLYADTPNADTPICPF